MRTGPSPFTDFSVHVAPFPEGGTDVAVFGELDLATVDQVEAALDEAMEAEGRVVIDLRACGFIDSRGVGALIKVALGLREQSRELLIRGVQERVMRTLEVAGLTSMEHLAIEPRERRRQE